MSQLQGQLDEGVRAGPALLDQTFPKGVERERVEIHVAGQERRAAQGRLDHLLALGREQRQALLVGK